MILQEFSFASTFECQVVHSVKMNSMVAHVMALVAERDYESLSFRVLPVRTKEDVVDAFRRFSAKEASVKVTGED